MAVTDYHHRSSLATVRSTHTRGYGTALALSALCPPDWQPLAIDTSYIGYGGGSALKDEQDHLDSRRRIRSRHLRSSSGRRSPSEHRSVPTSHTALLHSAGSKRNVARTLHDVRSSWSPPFPPIYVSNVLGGRPSFSRDYSSESGCETRETTQRSSIPDTRKEKTLTRSLDLGQIDGVQLPYWMKIFHPRATGVLPSPPGTASDESFLRTDSRLRVLCMAAAWLCPSLPRTTPGAPALQRWTAGLRAVGASVFSPGSPTATAGAGTPAARGLGQKREQRGQANELGIA